MKKKYIVKDADGEEFVVTEETEETPAEETSAEDGCNDEDTLSAEETSALKRLAAVADKLVALVAEPVEDEDELEETTEEVVATDSVSAAGSIETKQKPNMNDSVDRQEAINAFWRKKLNGGK